MEELQYPKTWVNPETGHVWRDDYGRPMLLRPSKKAVQSDAVRKKNWTLERNKAYESIERRIRDSRRAKLRDPDELRLAQAYRDNAVNTAKDMVEFHKTLAERHVEYVLHATRGVVRVRQCAFVTLRYEEQVKRPHSERDLSEYEDGHPMKIAMVNLDTDRFMTTLDLGGEECALDPLRGALLRDGLRTARCDLWHVSIVNVSPTGVDNVLGGWSQKVFEPIVKSLAKHRTLCSIDFSENHLGSLGASGVCYQLLPLRQIVTLKLANTFLARGGRVGADSFGNKK